MVGSIVSTEPGHIGKIPDRDAEPPRAAAGGSVRSGAEQAELRGSACGRGPRRHVQLRVNRPQVRVHGPSAELKLLGHLLVVRPSRQPGSAPDARGYVSPSALADARAASPATAAPASSDRLTAGQPGAGVEGGLPALRAEARVDWPLLAAR